MKFKLDGLLWDFEALGYLVSLISISVSITDLDLNLHLDTGA